MKFYNLDVMVLLYLFLNKNRLELLQDFIIESDNKSLHVLNTISPGFTCSIPFSEWIVSQYIK